MLVTTAIHGLGKVKKSRLGSIALESSNVTFARTLTIGVASVAFRTFRVTVARLTFWISVIFSCTCVAAGKGFVAISTLVTLVTHNMRFAGTLAVFVTSFTRGSLRVARTRFAIGESVKSG